MIVKEKKGNNMAMTSERVHYLSRPSNTYKDTKNSREGMTTLILKTESIKRLLHTASRKTFYILYMARE